VCKCITSLIFVTHVKAIIVRGLQELAGPGSLNCLNPRFLRHCIDHLANSQAVLVDVWHLNKDDKVAHM